MKGWVGLWLGVTGAIVIYGVMQVRHLAKAAIKVLSVSVKKIALTNLHLIVNLELENKGDFSALITQRHFVISINGVNVSTINIEGGDLHINSNGKTLIPVEIDVNPSKTVAIGIQNLGNIKSKIIIGIKGHLSLKAGNLVSLKDYPIDLKFTLKELLEKPE